MSGWDQHLDYILKRDPKVADKGALIYFAAAPGSRVVAATPDFTISDDEIDVLVKIYNSPAESTNDQPSDKDHAFTNGFDIAGEHYKCLDVVDRVIRGKQGKNGVTISKTNTLIIVGHYDENIQPNSNNNAVEQLADHLVSSNY